MIEKVKRMLGLAKKRPNNLLLINVEKLERRVALLEDGVLEEYTVERVSDRNIVGGIFKGRVKNIEPGLKAMFVDIGYEKNAFLHFWDALPWPRRIQVRKDRPPRGQKGWQQPKTAASQETHQQGHPHALPGRQRGHGAGHQGPHRHERPPRHHQPLARGPFPGPHALQRPERHQQENRRPQGARPPPQDPPRTGTPRGHGRHHADRRGRPAPPASSCATSRSCSNSGTPSRKAARPAPRARLPLRGTRPHRPHGARLPHRRGGQGGLRRRRAPSPT